MALSPDGRGGPARIGIVVGLVAEARIAARLGPVETGGGLPAGAREAAERLVGRGVTALVSFGLAGGLDPNLPPGHLVIPEAVLEDGVRYPTDPALSDSFGGANAALMLAGAEIVANGVAKRDLFRATGACAVDLESGAVARVARRHDLPFAVLRAICDPAKRDLPPAALVALDAGGAIGLLRVLISLARQPGQIGGLIRLARDARLGRQALMAVSRDSPAETAPRSAPPRHPDPRD
jgi:adenosylhomocysteine nucleosidase